MDLGFHRLQTRAGHTVNSEALKETPFSRGLFPQRKKKSLSYPDLRLGDTISCSPVGARVWCLGLKDQSSIPGGVHHPQGVETAGLQGPYLEVGILRGPHPPKSYILCSLHLLLHPGIPNGHYAPFLKK